MRSTPIILFICLFSSLTTNLLEAAHLEKRAPIVSASSPLTAPNPIITDHLAIIARFNPDTRTFAYLGTATFLNPTTAVTAAHIFEQEELDFLFLLQLRNPPSWEVDFYPLSTLIRDSRYLLGDKYYDYAFCQLDHPIPLLQTLALSKTASPLKSNYHAVGWTRTAEGLTPITLPPQSIERSDGEIALIPVNTLVSEALPQETQIGAGNSGSPLFSQKGEDGAYTLAGILSAVIKSADRTTDERVIYIPEEAFAPLTDDTQWTAQDLENITLQLRPQSNKIIFYQQLLTKHHPFSESTLHLFLDHHDLGLASNPKTWESLTDQTEAFSLLTLCHPEQSPSPSPSSKSPPSPLGYLKPNQAITLRESEGSYEPRSGRRKWKLLFQSDESKTLSRQRIELNQTATKNPADVEIAIWSIETRQLIHRETRSDPRLDFDIELAGLTLITISEASSTTENTLSLAIHSLDPETNSSGE